MMRNGWGRAARGFDGRFSPHHNFRIILLMVIGALIVAGITLLMVWLVRRHQQSKADTVAGAVAAVFAAPGSALEILGARYARGEIEKAEFEEKKKDLSS